MKLHVSATFVTLHIIQLSQASALIRNLINYMLKAVITE